MNNILNLNYSPPIITKTVVFIEQPIAASIPLNQEQNGEMSQIWVEESFDTEGVEFL